MDQVLLTEIVVISSLLNVLGITMLIVSKTMKKRLHEKEELREETLTLFKKVNGDTFKQYALSKQNHHGVKNGEKNLFPICRPTTPSKRKVEYSRAEGISNYTPIDMTLFYLLSTIEITSLLDSATHHLSEDHHSVGGAGSLGSDTSYDSSSGSYDGGSSYSSSGSDSFSDSSSSSSGSFD